MLGIETSTIWEASKGIVNSETREGLKWLRYRALWTTD